MSGFGQRTRYAISTFARIISHSSQGTYTINLNTLPVSVLKSAFPIKMSCERYATIRLAIIPEVIRINVNSPERSIQNENIAMAVIKKLIFNLSY
jgi:hypothetical protein